MFPFQVDPEWYEKHWWSDRPVPEGQSFAGNVVRFAVAAALLAGGGALLNQFKAGHDGGGQQVLEHQ